MEVEKLIIRSKTPEGVISFDEYGFAIFSEDPGDIERNHNYTSASSFSTDHVSAWQRYLGQWPESFLGSQNKLRFLLRRGVPRELRAELWGRFLGCEQQRLTSSFSYAEFVRALRSQLVELEISEYCLRPANQAVWDDEERKGERGGASKEGVGTAHHPSHMKDLVPLKTLRQIVVDLERTFPTHKLFMGSKPEAQEGRAALFRLLSVYALYNPEVGYCQGMSYLVGMLLMVMNSEEDVFWAMVALFEKPKYLAGYFDSNLKRIQSHASLFHRLLGQRFPKVARHFDSLGVQPLMYVTSWFMCLYTSLPCWDTVLAIWDLIFLDGVTTIFRVGLSMIELHRDVILTNTDLTKILPPLLHPKPEKASYDVLMPVVWKTCVEKWEIETLHAIITEEEGPTTPGLKRRHREERVFGGVTQETKRMKLEEKTKPAATSSFFQRVVNIFTPRTQRDQEVAAAAAAAPSGALSSQGTLWSGRQPRRNQPAAPLKGPGAAKPARQHNPSESQGTARHQHGNKGQQVCEQEAVTHPRRTTDDAFGAFLSAKGAQLFGDMKSQSRGAKGSSTATGSSRETFGPSLKSGTSQGESRMDKVAADTGTSKKNVVRPAAVNQTSSVSGLKPLPHTPRTAGRSKLFSRLHSQIFGGEIDHETKPKLSHPLEDVSMTTASPDCSPVAPKSRNRLSKEEEASGVWRRTSPRLSSRSPKTSSWMSPYCRQYMVQPDSLIAHTSKTSGTRPNNSDRPHLSRAKIRSPKPHPLSSRSPRRINSNPSQDLAKRFKASPRSSASRKPFGSSVVIQSAKARPTAFDKENNSSALSPDFTKGGQGRAPSIESLASTPDGVLSVLGNLDSGTCHEMRSPLSEHSQNHDGFFDNNNSIFKTPSHPMSLRHKAHTPGMYAARTPKSEGRHLLAKENPLNVPSGRRLVCRTARAQHSFKIFHTPTPLRQPKVLESDHHQSPCLSSPEVELTNLGMASPSASLNFSMINLDD